VRGDATLTARLLLRGPGLAGLLAAAGGLVAVVATTRPWYAAVVTVEMLGDEGERTVATLPGLPSSVGAWVALALGALAVALGAAVAIDRPPHWARWGLGGAATGLAVIALVAGLQVPRTTVVAGEQTARLDALAERLPTGVALDLRTEPRGGVWLVLVAAGMVGGGALAAREV
jgi:hypothetical protein